MVDAPNLVFAGCTLLRGSGTAMVYATGRRTEFGKIAELSVEVRRSPTPLEREVSRMVRVLTVVAVVMGAAFFAYGVAIGRPVWVNVVFMVGIIVANVPEGLLPTLTLALAMGGLRLAKKKVLVKSLNAVEALGSVEVICTDKTGTLTKNELAVTSVVDAPSGEPLGDGKRRELLEVAVAASEIHGRAGALTGDPLDVAAASLLTKLGGDPLALSRDIVRHIAFDVQRRRAAGVLKQGESWRFAIKGAWEVVRPRVAASDEERARCDETVRRLASQGLRIIAVASRRIAAGEVAAPESVLEEGLELHGFLCLSDPIRDEVPDAVARCHRAGIRVILVTGDHPDTARAIAERAGIVPPNAPAEAVLTGDVLEAMRETDLALRLHEGLSVFARTTPEQKLKIVSAIKRMGLLVAMTGDGVNDAPALRAADVGIAMGQAGTDVAREAAQIVLLDDNFASIVAGVEEGRTVFSNIRKFTSYVLASNVPEMAPFLAYIVLPVPLGLTVVQILSIDLGTDLVPAIGLGQEPPDGEAMNRPPRGRRG
ncbi:MAG TPA: cation-transporting P-type ATPase, partial [Polyangiaceae bacterium]